MEPFSVGGWRFQGKINIKRHQEVKEEMTYLSILVDQCSYHGCCKTSIPKSPKSSNLNIGWFTVNCEMKFSTKHRYVYLRDCFLWLSPFGLSELDVFTMFWVFSRIIEIIWLCVTQTQRLITYYSYTLCYLALISSYVHLCVANQAF